MRVNVVIRTKIINESPGWNGLGLPGEPGECPSDLGMASNHCGMPPRLKGINHVVIARSLRVQPQAIMGSGLVD